MMKGKLVYLLGTMTLSLSIIGFLLAILSASAATPSITSNTAWIDNFDNTTLNGRWSWVREDPTHWDLTSQPGYLHLVTKGSLFQTSNNLQNILTTPANGDNFQLITRVTISPTENYQSAGLLVYQDDDNYIEVSRVYNNGGKVRIRSEVGGATTSIYVDEIIETVYLRIDKEADRYLGFYSLDGNNWTHIGQYTVTLTSPYIGITAGNQPTMAEVNAYFNFVQYTPVEYNYAAFRIFRIFFAMYRLGYPNSIAYEYGL